MFADRRQAGRELAGRLAPLPLADPLALGMPRGGVIVAATLAEALGWPLDVVLVRKLGAPHQRELAIGAIGEGGVRVLNEDVLHVVGATAEDIAAIEAAESAVLAERAERYRRAHPMQPRTGRTVVVVDDGVATGASARAALAVVRAQGAAPVVFAAPVIAAGAIVDLQALADEVVAVAAPVHLGAVGAWYQYFGEVSDEEVLALLP